MSTWKRTEFTPLPKIDPADLEKVPVHEVVNFKLKVDGKEVPVFYQQARPEHPRADILLLHGASFSSKTWVDPPMQTLQTLFKLGYNAVAIDLPGYGRSTPAVKVDHSKFMEELIKALRLNRPIIVSPSMSGGYMLPYIFQDVENAGTRIGGWVPVAPIGATGYSKSEYQSLKIPTLNIGGERDRTSPESTSHLTSLPNSETFVYEGATHAAYLSKPGDFHRDLYNFLRQIEAESNND